MRVKMQYVPKHKESESKEGEEKESTEEVIRLEKGRKEKKKRRIIAITGIFALLIIGWIVYALISPGKYDNFAKCLTEKGAVMYGEDWCKYTQAQKGMFGKSFKYIDYEVKEGLKVRPTWVIDGRTYERVQSFETLSAVTGCKI